MDSLRVVLVISGFLLLAFIGRAVKEGIERHIMSSGQISRFLGLALLAGNAAYASIERFGTQINAHILVNLLGILFSWYGVWHIRRKQKNDPALLMPSEPSPAPEHRAPEQRLPSSRRRRDDAGQT